MWQRRLEPGSVKKKNPTSVKGSLDFFQVFPSFGNMQNNISSNLGHPAKGNWAWGLLDNFLF